VSYTSKNISSRIENLLIETRITSGVRAQAHSSPSDTLPYHEGHAASFSYQNTWRVSRGIPELE
jgi:hypothetical protein